MTYLVTDNSLCGALAMWVCRQHPYHSVSGVDDVTAVIRERAKADGWDGNDELRLSEFDTFRDLEKWLQASIGQHPQMAIWNTPKTGDVGPFKFVSRYSAHNPETDFIDIDALLRNTALEAWREAKSDHEFEQRYTSPHPTHPNNKSELEG